MTFIDASERRVAEAVAALAEANPFLPERVEYEKRALGRRFVATDAVWHAPPNASAIRPNLRRLAELVEEFVPVLRERLARPAAGAAASESDLLLYEGCVRYFLYQRYENDWLALIERAKCDGPSTRRAAAFDRFEKDVQAFLCVPGVRLPSGADAAWLFALGFQVRRAFYHTFGQIFGGSRAAARLRASVWQSIFTSDMGRYRRSLALRMREIPTLICGRSGTGKELVARSIGLSSFVPFDAAREAFAADYTKCFHAVNLSALSPTLIESELFGHRRGAFTGALEDCSGWLAACGVEGSVFLDEIGELSGEIQVKLLRALQDRRFQRIGETTVRRFEGKLLAATNRDLAREIREGRFREDLYYRLCADQIATPTLREQLADSPDELHHLLDILARRIAGEQEAEALAAQTGRWIESELGLDYDWPGNVRELEQCVRSVLIRGEYRPNREPRGAGYGLAAELARGELSAEALLRRYCTELYARTGSYEETARRLGLDRRTVKAKLDRELLEELREERLQAEGTPPSRARRSRPPVRSSPART